VTLTGLRIEQGDTLDLSKVKLTATQFFVVVAAVAGVIGATSVSLYQLSELRRGQQDMAQNINEFSRRLESLELDKARREGAEQQRRNNGLAE
jgi:hypothetical protein